MTSNPRDPVGRKTTRQIPRRIYVHGWNRNLPAPEVFDCTIFKTRSPGVAFAQRTKLFDVMMARAFSGHNVRRPMPQGVPERAAFTRVCLLPGTLTSPLMKNAQCNIANTSQRNQRTEINTFCASIRLQLCFFRKYQPVTKLLR